MTKKERTSATSDQANVCAKENQHFEHSPCTTYQKINKLLSYSEKV